MGRGPDSSRLRIRLRGVCQRALTGRDGFRETPAWRHPESIYDRALAASRDQRGRPVPRPRAAALVAAQRARGADARHERYEVVLVHDYDDPRFVDLLDRHPLVGSGAAAADADRARDRKPGATAQHRLARGARQLVAFTDDDCRPDTGWLRRCSTRRRAGGDRPGSDPPRPARVRVIAAPHYRSLRVDPPNLFAQTCNIAYPRALLERLGGFDEAMPCARRRGHRSGAARAGGGRRADRRARGAGLPRGRGVLLRGGAAEPKWQHLSRVSASTRSCATSCRWASSGARLTRSLRARARRARLARRRRLAAAPHAALLAAGAQQAWPTPSARGWPARSSSPARSLSTSPRC